MIEAALTSVSRVPQYAMIYRRIGTRSNKQKAIVAVARRMLEDAWTMLRRDEVFGSIPVVQTFSAPESRISGTAEALPGGVADPSAAG